MLILPYTIWTLRGFIANVPRELDEAALVDGCTRWQTFNKILLPLTAARPGRRRDLRLHPGLERVLHHQHPEPERQQGEPDGLADVQPDPAGTFWGPLMAGAMLTSIPVVIFFLIIQKNIATGLTAGAVKG